MADVESRAVEGHRSRGAEGIGGTIGEADFGRSSHELPGSNVIGPGAGIAIGEEEGAATNFDQCLASSCDLAADHSVTAGDGVQGGFTRGVDGEGAVDLDVGCLSAGPSEGCGVQGDVVDQGPSHWSRTDRESGGGVGIGRAVAEAVELINGDVVTAAGAELDGGNAVSKLTRCITVGGDGSEVEDTTLEGDGAGAEGKSVAHGEGAGADRGHDVGAGDTARIDDGATAIGIGQDSAVLVERQIQRQCVVARLDEAKIAVKRTGESRALANAGVDGECLVGAAVCDTACAGETADGDVLAIEVEDGGVVDGDVDETALGHCTITAKLQGAFLHRDRAESCRRWDHQAARAGE